MAKIKIPINGEIYKNEEGIVLVDGLNSELTNGYISQLGAICLRPGLIDFSNLGIGKILGTYYYEKEDLLIVVASGKIYRIDKHGEAVDITDAKLLPDNRVFFDEDKDFVYMCNGGKVVCYATWLQYLQTNTDHYELAERSTDGNIGNLNIDYDYRDATIYMPDEHAPIRVSHLTIMDTYMLMRDMDNLGRFVYSEVSEPLNISPLNFATAEFKSDDLVAIDARRDELLLPGTRTIEFWQNDGSSPFSRIGGVSLDIGLGAPDSLVPMDNGWYFISNERRYIYLNGRSPVALSAPYDKELHKLTRIDNAIGDNIVVDGNSWYVVSFPSDDKTIIYDAKLKRFQGNWASWDSVKADYTRWRGNCYTYIPQWNKHIVGDISNGKVYEMRSDVYKDGNDNIRLEWVSGNVSHGTNTYKRSNRLSLKLKRGSKAISPKPQLALYYKDDNKDWSEPRYVDLGNVGDTEMIKELHSLGTYRNRQYKIEYSDNAPFTLIDIEEDVDILDR